MLLNIELNFVIFYLKLIEFTIYLGFKSIFKFGLWVYVVNKLIYIILVILNIFCEMDSII